ncbi:phosphodiester glycosidase family protein [Martelella sp. HB161492]|uniref:phosphodiester glycosidase family protein n=1 Tax=Martelella sp. HB161492 TaxID=2720726 RepID=UPI001FEF119A|nr:phosphodiester glycosidase family protein [Martelella sp. HB161492]
MVMTRCGNRPAWLAGWLGLLIVLIAAATPAKAACDNESHSGRDYVVCTFDPAVDDIRLFSLDAGGEPYRSFGNVAKAVETQGLDLAFAMNGGMYDDDGRPIGLYVEDGTTLKPASTRKGYGNFHLLPNGVFALGGGKAVVEETRAYLASGFKADFATQSGPMLVIDGKLHPRFLPDSDSFKRRNGVGVNADGKVVLVISRQAVSFYDFALVFRDDLGCDNALFLDGTISSLYAPELGRNDRLFPLGPIIAVVTAAKG